MGLLVFLYVLGLILPEVEESEKIQSTSDGVSEIAPFETSETSTDGAFITATVATEEETVTEHATYYSVIKVVDGDTLTIDRDGSPVTVRLIGIDTPETVDPRTTVECFGTEASNKAKELLTGKRVRIETDTTQGERDKYERLLAYVYLEDGLFINEYMVLEGFAYEYTYAVPYVYQKEFKEAEALARIQEKGLWEQGVCDTPEPTPAPVKPYTSPQQTSSQYSCSSNMYNCTDFNTHAQAQSVYEQCGGIAHDVHMLDRDRDGVACESLP